MKKYNTPEQFAEFIHFIAKKKRNFSEWSYLHMSVAQNIQKDIIGEIVQFLDFEIQDEKAALYTSEKPQELILVGGPDSKSSISNLEQKIYTNFASNSLRATLGDFNENNIDRFRDFLMGLVGDDPIAKVGAMRLCRLSNSVMVLDDDIMITKQIEKALEGFGRVTTLNNHEHFIENYRTYAPNVLFLDIHLGKVRGPNILDMFFEKIDPFAHVIIISSDTGAETIKEVKARGAHGFVVKPFNRQKLLDQVVACPTFYKRKAR